MPTELVGDSRESHASTRGREPLREIGSIRHDSDRGHRRWFQNEYFDVYIWQGARGTPIAFHISATSAAAVQASFAGAMARSAAIGSTRLGPRMQSRR
jgi:hypothetical protein